MSYVVLGCGHRINIDATGYGVSTVQGCDGCSDGAVTILTDSTDYSESWEAVDEAPEDEETFPEGDVVDMPEEEYKRLLWENYLTICRDYPGYGANNLIAK